MSTRVQFRRGTTAEHATFTGAEGEITVDTEKNSIVVHDGVTVGGNPLGNLVHNTSSGPNQSVSFAQNGFHMANCAGDDSVINFTFDNPSDISRVDLIMDIKTYINYELPRIEYDNVSFSVSSQDDSPWGIAFSSDGTKMFMLGLQNQRVYQYSLSTAWDISSASYNVFFSVSSQDETPLGIAFSSDGSRMFMVGDTNDSVYQYSLSTAWDISSASYDNVSFSVSQDSTPRDIAFSSDGTKMFMVGSSSDRVYQYSLSTAWDLSTASYNNVSFSVSSQDSIPFGIAFSSDGTKMFLVGVSTDSVYQYSLSTAWDISSASYDNVSFSVSQDTTPTGIAFSSDGTNMFMVGNSNDSVYQYNVLPDYNKLKPVVSYTSFSTQDTNPYDIAFSSDGTKMFMVGFNTDSVFRYSLSTAWDIGSASYDNVSFSVSSQDTSPLGIAFSSDGAKMFILGNSNRRVYQYSLSTAWNVSTASYDNVSFSVSSQDTSPLGIAFSSDGTKMFILGNSNRRVYQYSLSTAWDIGSASYDSVLFSVSSQDTSPSGITFSSDGTKMFMVGFSTDSVHQYSLSTAWDISSASYDSVSFSVSSQDSLPSGIAFSSDGTKMFMVGDSINRVYQYKVGYFPNINMPSELVLYRPLKIEKEGKLSLTLFTVDGGNSYEILHQTFNGY